MFLCCSRSNINNSLPIYSCRLPPLDWPLVVQQATTRIVQFSAGKFGETQDLETCWSGWTGANHGRDASVSRSVDRQVKAETAFLTTRLKTTERPRKIGTAWTTTELEAVAAKKRGGEEWTNRTKRWWYKRLRQFNSVGGHDDFDSEREEHVRRTTAVC